MVVDERSSVTQTHHQTSDDNKNGSTHDPTAQRLSRVDGDAATIKLEIRTSCRLDRRPSSRRLYRSRTGRANAVST